MFGFGFSIADFNAIDWTILFFLSFILAIIYTLITGYLIGMRSFHIFLKCVLVNPRLFFFILRRPYYLFNFTLQFHIIRKLMKMYVFNRPSIEQIKKNVIAFEIYKETLQNGRHTILLNLIELRLIQLRRDFEKKYLGFSVLNRYGREKRVKKLVKDIVNQFGLAVGCGQPDDEHLARAIRLESRLEQEIVRKLMMPGIEAEYLPTGFNWGRKLSDTNLHVDISFHT
ncbi:hypothetical protein DERF_011664 [Dermatophagoides farinae]|uniref:Uncharacterized protein n=1 Tax=Dermatophagoides farinae TaxID=6954 RepID=A0A922HUZ8_DERFA|nr:hypothetical protein DERF_011664 [Dermatophagoides farinae]